MLGSGRPGGILRSLKIFTRGITDTLAFTGCTEGSLSPSRSARSARERDAAALRAAATTPPPAAARSIT
jgi:hypothetical protein